MRTIPGRTPQELLEDRISKRQARLAVVGLGYVGLPLAVEMARAGFAVVGIDRDERKVQGVNAARSYIGDIADEELAAVRDEDRLVATTDYAAIRTVDAVSICVPTPLSKMRDPDISFIVAAAEEIAAQLHPGLLVVLESTTYPGTTREVILPRLSRDGQRVGVDFFLAFSPERVDPGNVDFKVHNTPKIVGGVTPECTALAVSLYDQFIERVLPVSSPESAEMVKLLENTFRSVNIGLVNEVAIMCDKLRLDVWEVIEAAASKPFGFMPFFPGPGLGGHCIPIDPLYLSWKLRTLNYQARFIELASDVNTHMPEFVVTKLSDRLNDRSKCLRGSRIMVLGAAYKRDVSDMRESPALDIIRLLHEKGSTVVYHDPYVERLDLEGTVMESVALTDEVLAAQDAVIVVTDHACFDYDRIVDRSSLVMDTRNAARRVKAGREKIVKL
ncbi:MAG: nucleotide sugar dehydrogenase [Candidatus Riflebacteria bacterium]|nr:nucleotide sugar dehydrogenase [Candidatus Riflebacteria bacterium]